MSTEKRSKAKKSIKLRSSTQDAVLVVRRVNSCFFYPKEREKMKSKARQKYERDISISHPTRNRYFCNAIGRTKMLFKTEAEAKLYLAYNCSEPVDGSSKPCRAYRCNCCDGWHVTHLELLPMHSMMREMKVIERHVKKHAKYIA
jgi:hypothetical protein